MRKMTVRVNEDGSFAVTPIVQHVAGGLGVQVYKVAEDILRRGVGYSPILTGAHRASGSVFLKGRPIPLKRMKLTGVNPETGAGRAVIGLRSGLPVVQQIVSRRMYSGTQFTFSIGFAMPYSLWLHQEEYNLGPRSQQANKAGPYQGKVGPHYLTRVWDDYESRYISFLQNFGSVTKL